MRQDPWMMLKEMYLYKKKNMKGRSVYSWDEEVMQRLDSLKCRMCGGVNPYICECARIAWAKQMEPQRTKKAANFAEEDRALEEEWKQMKGCMCSFSAEVCKTCNTGELRESCDCAKKEWMERKKREVKFPGLETLLPGNAKGPWTFGSHAPSDFFEPLESKWRKHIENSVSLCAVCPRCQGSSISTCECAKQRWMEEEKKKFTGGGESNCFIEAPKKGGNIVVAM